MNLESSVKLKIETYLPHSNYAVTLGVTRSLAVEGREEGGGGMGPVPWTKG